MLLVGLCFIFRLRKHQTSYADFDFDQLFPTQDIHILTMYTIHHSLKQAINIHNLKIHHIMLYKLSALS